MVKRNLTQITPHFIVEIMGYEVYIPDSYNNPLSYNKEGCPIWVKMDDDNNCYVHIQEKDNNLQEEIAVFISQNLPKKPTLHCCNLTLSISTVAIKFALNL